MMVSRIVLRTMMVNLKSVTEAFNSTNNELARRNQANMFVTVWLGVIDLRSGHVEFASAGHNPPAVRHKDGSVEFVNSRAGLVMAAMEDTRYKPQSFDLLPGDMLFLYTDGVTEATNLQEELYGEKRLLNALAECAGTSTSKTCEHVKQSIDSFVGGAPQFDDITMLAVQYKGGGIKNMEFTEEERREMTVDVAFENVDKLISFVEGELSPLEGSVKAKRQIYVAIDEIFSNIVKFSGASQVTLLLDIDKNKPAVRLTFADDGTPYDPLQRPDPDVTLPAEERGIGGLGIFIVKKTMDLVVYRRNGGKNELIVTKVL